MRFLLAGLVVEVSKIHAYFPTLALLRPALVFALLCLLYAVANPKALDTGRLLRTWPAKVMAGLGFLACLSVPFGLSIGGSAMYILTEYSKTLILAFLLVAAIRNASDLLAFVWAVVIGTGCLTYLAVFVFRVSGTQSGITRIAGGYAYDANDMCVIGVIGLVMALLAFQITSARGKLVCVMVLVSIGMMIARSGSRGGFLGLVAVGGAMFVMVRTVSLDKKLAVVALLGLGIFLSAPEGYMQQMETILHPTQDYNYDATSGRLEIWKRGMGYMLSRPLTGIGIDNFQRAEGTIADVHRGA
jgi:O-antigen ligase